MSSIWDAAMENSGDRTGNAFLKTSMWMDMTFMRAGLRTLKNT